MNTHDDKPGCICSWPPEKKYQHDAHMLSLQGLPPTEENLRTAFAAGGSMTLDHRCKHHGEKAQPALWGRHKELHLLVKGQEWLALASEPESIDEATRALKQRRDTLRKHAERCGAFFDEDGAPELLRLESAMNELERAAVGVVLAGGELPCNAK